jgi:trk system potassium uptake protein TrkA
MHFVVMGCGRVGVNLVKRLVDSGHSVAVIDNNRDSFNRLPVDFDGEKVVGFGFDVDTLRRAGIQDAFAFAAVTANDNTNILAARVVREKFGLEKVVARIFDVSRAEVFEKLGVPTVATIRWTADQVLRHMIPLGATDEFRDPTGSVSLIQVDYDESWLMHTVAKIEELSGARVAYITRLGEAFLPSNGDLLQLNDILHLLAPVGKIQKVSHLLAKRFDMATDGTKGGVVQ